MRLSVWELTFSNCSHSMVFSLRRGVTIVFQKKILGLADSELAQVAICIEETPKYLS